MTDKSELIGAATRFRDALARARDAYADPQKHNALARLFDELILVMRGLTSIPDTDKSGEGYSPAKASCEKARASCDRAAANPTDSNYSGCFDDSRAAIDSLDATIKAAGGADSVALPLMTPRTTAANALRRMFVGNKSAVLFKDGDEYALYGVRKILAQVEAGGGSSPLENLGADIRVAARELRKTSGLPPHREVSEIMRLSTSSEAADWQNLQVIASSPGEVLVIGLVEEIRPLRMAPTVCECTCGLHHASLHVSHASTDALCPGGEPWACGQEKLLG